MIIIKEIGEALLQLVFPKLCIACFQSEPMSKNVFCLTCHLELPYTDQFDIRDNHLEMRLKGRVPFERGAALFRYRKEGKVQKVISQLKYKNRPTIGIELGKMFARKVRNSKEFEIPDIVVPVPLHSKKQHLRGYNQSFQFALGIARELEIPASENIVIRNIATESQTQKGRIGRMENMMHSFKLKRPNKIKGKHVLLVDDVITTGATLEATALKLLESEDVRLSLGLIAMAEA